MPDTLRISLAGNALNPGASAADTSRAAEMRVNVDPDEQLLERIGRGDTAAVPVLVARKLPRLRSLARRMLGDPVEAEDVAQETLVRTWKQARDWVPGKARIDTWMHRVALNLCYDRLRRRRDQVSTDDVEIGDGAAGPHAAVEKIQNAAALQSALMALPERQRVPIMMLSSQELSNTAAAARAPPRGKPLGTGRNRCSGACRSRIPAVPFRRGRSVHRAGFRPG